MHIYSVIVCVAGCCHAPLVNRLFHLSVKVLTICKSVMSSTGKCKTTKAVTLLCYLMCSVFPRITPIVHPNEGNT